MSDNATLITVLVVALIIFIVCREFTCWYFKINKTVELLEEIRDSLKNKPYDIATVDIDDRNVVWE